MQNAQEQDIELDQEYLSYLVAFRVEGLSNLEQLSQSADWSIERQLNLLASDRLRSLLAPAFTEYRHAQGDVLGTLRLPRAFSGREADELESFGLKLLYRRDEWHASRPLALAELRFRNFAEARTALERLYREGQIEFAEPNRVSVPQDALEDFNKALTPYHGESGLAASAWWLDAIRLGPALQILSDKAAADPAWLSNLFANPPVVAIMDSGVDYEHPSLAGQLIGPTTPNAAGCSNDRNGCNTTVSSKGWLGNGDVFPYGTTGPGQKCFGLSDEFLSSMILRGKKRDTSRLYANDIGTCGHGTHVAALIVGKPSGDNGAAGVCPFCKVLPVRVVSDELEGKIPDSAIFRGLKYISAFKRDGKPLVKIINMSFGKYSRSRSVSLIIRSLREQGTIMIAAAGNEDSMRRAYPGGYGDAIAVSALDRNMRRAPYSNFGPWVDVAAPGGAELDIISAFPGNSWQGQNGTSQATPLVAGVAALYVAANPDASYEEIRSTILSTADGGLYSASVAGGYNKAFLKTVSGESTERPLLGSGLVDAEAALSGEIQGLTAAQRNDRVERGCSTIAFAAQGSSKESEGSTKALLVLLLPLALLLLQRRRAS